MYIFMLDKITLPITPSKVSTKVKGMNKTYELVNYGEVNLVKYPGLTVYNFDFDLYYDIENIQHKASNLKPNQVLDFLEDAKKNKKVIDFVIARKMRNEMRFSTEQLVTVEDYTVEEDSDNNSDITVSIELKQFRPYRTKHVKSLKEPRPIQKKTDTKKSPKNGDKKAIATSTLKKVKIKTPLNIRIAPGVYSKQVSKFSVGETPCVYGEAKDKKGSIWYKVKHSAGKDGWAYINGNSKYSDVLKNFKK